MASLRPSNVLDAWAQALPSTQCETWIDPHNRAIAGLASRFRATVESALRHDLDRWHRKSGGSVALVLLLDVFARSLWRGEVRSLSGDLHAQSLALQAVAVKRDRRMIPDHRAILLFPLMHAEVLDMQSRSVEGFSRLVQEHGNRYRPLLEHALERQEIIERFGRFPHRNDLLERKDSVSEASWLATDAPGWAVPWTSSGSGPKAP